MALGGYGHLAAYIADVGTGSPEATEIFRSPSGFFEIAAHFPGNRCSGICRSRLICGHITSNRCLLCKEDHVSGKIFPLFFQVFRKADKLLATHIAYDSGLFRNPNSLRHRVTGFAGPPPAQMAKSLSFS